MLKSFQRLWVQVEIRRKLQLGLLLLILLLASVAEMLSIGAIVPFLAVIANPAQANAHPSLHFFAAFLGISDASKLLAIIAFGFGIAALISALVRAVLIYISSRLSYSIGADLSSRIFLNVLEQPYIRHLNRNTSEVIAGITSKSNNVISGIIVPALMLVSSLVILVTIASVLAYIDVIMTVGAAVVFVAIYVALTRIMRKHLTYNGERIAYSSVLVMRSLQEGLGGIREVLLEGNQHFYCDQYKRADRAMRDAQGTNLFIAQFPRYAMEGIALFLIAIFASIQTLSPTGLNDMLPTLGALAMGAGRMLPVLQHAYGSWANIQGSLAELEDVLVLLEERPLSRLDAKFNLIEFRNYVRFKNVSFSYDGKPVLSEISMVLRKGDFIGIVGRSGSGKSTLVDLIMGLLEPTAGSIDVDGATLNVENMRSWQMHIAHVPQAIFLLDANIADNITFGMSGACPSLQVLHDIVTAVGLADLAPTPEDLLRIGVGERGSRISGGQRQRIAIARALVRKADIIVLDEATSALDPDTESDIVKMLQKLGESKTIIMISHRMSALKNCTRILRVEEGQVIEVRN